jgi:O-antigen/teichoic acid export membrane protein
MGIVFRQSVKSVIVILAGNVLGALFNYCSTYVFGEQFRELGFSRLIFNVASIFQFVLLLGFNSVMQTLMQNYANSDKRKKVLITLCLLIPIVATIVLLPGYLFFREEIVHLFKVEDQAYFHQYYFWILFLVLLWSYMNLLESYLVSQHKAAQSMFMREVVLRSINMGILAAFYFQWISFHVYILCTILVYCLPVMVLLFLAKRTEGFGFSGRWRLFNKTEYKGIFHFSWYHLLTSVSVFLIGYLDVLMLATLDKNGMASVPAYSISVFIAGLMMAPFRAMAIAVVPVLNKAYYDKDMVELRDIYKRSGVNILIVAVGMSLVIGLNLNNAVAILPKGYESVSMLALILIIGKMAEMATGLNTELMSVSSLYKFAFRILLLLLLLVIVLNRLLIPKFGPYGAAWGVTIAVVVFNIAKTVFLQKKMGMHPFTSQSFKIVLIGLLIAAVVYFIPVIGHPVIDACIRTMIILAAYGFLLIRFRVSEDINTYLASVIKKKRLF